MLGCFVQAWESSLYKKLSDGLDKYMFHVVKNAALNELRDCKRRKTRHEKMMEGMPVAEIMHEDEQTEIDVLYFAINQLPPERRRIFMMVYAEGKKYKEVAEHLQISINTVRTQLSRSLKFCGRNWEGHMFTILLLYFRKFGIIRVVSQELAIQMGLLQFFYKKWDFLSHDLMGGGVICIKLGVWKTKY